MGSEKAQPKDHEQSKPERAKKLHVPATVPAPKEFSGPKGPEPTRYGDWENNGRCTDF